MLAQCPYCRVALVADGGSPITGLTPDQVKAVARHILGSVKFWVVVIVLIGAAAWGVVQLSQKAIDLRSKEYLSTLEDKTTNRIAAATDQISKQVSSQVSNQIVSEFKQPRIQAAIKAVAEERVNDVLTNSLWPSLEIFNQAVSYAHTQLAKSTNELSKLNKDIKAAQRKAAQAQLAPVTPVAPARIATPPTPPVTVTNSAPTAEGGTTKLTVANYTVAPNGPNYILTIAFKPTSATPIGPVSLVAATFNRTAKIVSFGLVTPGQSEPMVINDAVTRDAAQLKFTVAGGDAPVVGVELTGPTFVQVTGDALAQELTMPVAPEKMALPSAGK